MKINQMLRAASIYGGIGGGLLGAKWAGFEPYYMYENRDFFNWETFNHNFPSIFYNINKEYNLQNQDLIIGSPDCKQFSNLGTKRKDRGKLDKMGLKLEDIDFSQFLLFINYYKPESFILENVPNVLKYFEFKNGICYNTIDKEQSEINLTDYNIQVLKLDAYDYGIAQHRKRIYVVGTKKKYGVWEFDYLEQNIILDIIGMNIKGTIPINRTVGEAFMDIRGTPNHKKPNHKAERIEGFKKLKFGQSYYGTQNNKRLDPYKPAGTIASHCSRFVHPYFPRVLTVRETARLMGFPDNFIFYGTESNQLDQVGKSIVPQVSMVISYYIKQILENNGL